MLQRQSKKSLATKLRHMVTIQEKTESQNPFGDVVPSWSNVSGYDSVPASIEPITATRRAEFSSYNVRATHFIRMRGEIGINELHRIKYGTRYFIIHTIEDIQERDIAKLITAEEVRI